MISEYIKQHPNNGKVIVYTEAYLQMRHTLIEQISTIENNIKGTLLSNDEDIKQELLPCLKRTLKGLDRRFLRAGGFQDPVYCARLILDGEKEQITDPLQCCRYYNGQQIADDENAVFAEYEMRWMEWRSSTREDGYSLLLSSVVDYINCGLMMFDEYDKAPISLKALLFNRWCHWGGGWSNDPNSFKAWYYKNYCKGADNYERLQQNER